MKPHPEPGVSPETLQDLPLVISGAPRSSVTVAIFMPGVTTGGGGNAYNSRTNGGIITGDEAVVDGATAAEGFMNQSGMVSLQTDFGMSPDITSEVKILASNYDAQYGNSTSGQLIVQTRSGGETFHGAALRIFPQRRPERQAVWRPDQDTRQGKRLRRQRRRPDLDSRLPRHTDLGKRLLLLQLGGLPGPRRGQFLHLFHRLVGGPFGKLHQRRQPALLSLRHGQVWGLGGPAIPNNQIDPNFEDPIAKVFLSKLPHSDQWPGSQQLLHPQVRPGIVNQQRERVFLSHRHERRPDRSLLLHLLVAVQRGQRADRSAHRHLHCESREP